MGTDTALGTFAQATLDTLPLNVAILDADGAIVGTNRGWREFGVANGIETAPDTLGTSYLAVTDAAAADGAEDARRAAAGLREVLDGGRDLFAMEYPCHAPTERRWFLLRAAPFVHDGDRYAVVAHLDVTDRALAKREAERRREEMAAERERLALVNQLLRHDLRNDLNVVAGWADLVGEHLEPGGEESLERLLGAVEHTSELVEAASDLAEAVGSTGDALEPTDLGAVLTDEVEKLRAAYATRSTSVTVTGPELSEPGVEVLATPLLSSVFSNLLNNAVFHNDKADVRVEVTVEPREETVLVRVVDNGAGVPDALKRELFAQGEKRPESPGMGLGLYLVDTLVRLYGGSVWVEDREPEGAVFCVELRRA